MVTKYTAIIVEPRKHELLPYVLYNMARIYGGTDVSLYIFHGNKNIDYINSIIKDWSNVQLVNLNVDNLTINDYNILLTSKSFYYNFKSKYVLIFQTDSIICKENKNYINEFIKYDYVGAPWRNKNVGNGGLSLRKKSKMLEIIENCRYGNNNEDLYFSHACPQVILNKPIYEDSKYFSVETDYSDISFGVHKPWKHLSKDQLIEKTDYCEGLDILTELNKK
jgi:hypothetical protein